MFSVIRAGVKKRATRFKRWMVSLAWAGSAECPLTLPGFDLSERLRQRPDRS